MIALADETAIAEGLKKAVERGDDDAAEYQGADAGQEIVRRGR